MRRPLSEKEFQTQVIHLLRIKGFAVFHAFDSRRSTPGFPDIIATDGERMFAWEFKTEHGVPSKEQVAWLKLLKPFATDTRIARPSDWDLLVEIVTGKP